MLQQAAEELTEQARAVTGGPADLGGDAGVAAREPRARRRSDNSHGAGSNRTGAVAPMSTFIGQLIGFAVIVFLLWKYVVPPVRTMMKNQQETVRNQLAEHAEAEKKVADADKEHAKALEEAKAEAAKVIEEARHDAEKIAEQLRAQADAELERIKAQGAQQVQLLRQQLIRELRQSLGAESVQRAGEMVRNFVADPAEQSATVDRFLDELDEMAPSSTAFEDAVTAKLRAASRESLADAGRAVRRSGRRPRRRRAVDAGRRSGIDGRSCCAVSRSWPGTWPSRPAIRRAKVAARRAIAVRQGFRSRPRRAQDRCLAALVVHLRSATRNRAHRPAGACWCAPSATTRSRRSRTSCSGSAASSTPSRG